MCMADLPRRAWLALELFLLYSVNNIVNSYQEILQSVSKLYDFVTGHMCNWLMCSHDFLFQFSAVST